MKIQSKDSVQQTDRALLVQSKRCTKCGEVRSLSSFSRSRASPTGYMSQCKICKAEYDRLYNLSNRDTRRAQNRQRYHERMRMWKYGLTNEQWLSLFEKQGNCCAICKTKTPNRNQWCTDHDHSTGKVRGILCHHCNRALGLFQDSLSHLASATAYLQNPPHKDENQV
jgi:hypothetical protein